MRSSVMIPMRDGVKLHTVILVPRGAKGAPILLTRTPYDAKALTTRRAATWARAHATTTPTTSSSKAVTSAWSRTCAASTGPRATT
jgi:predicted acyl esterase